MKERNLTISNKLGLHARAASAFVRVTNKYKAQVKVLKDHQEVDGKSIMGLLTLAASCGSQLKLLVSGPDENELLNELETLVKNKFGEE